MGPQVSKQRCAAHCSPVSGTNVATLWACFRFARWREHIWQGVIVWTTLSHFLFLPPRVKPDLEGYDASQQPWPTTEPIRFELSAVYILFISFALVVRPPLLSAEVARRGSGLPRLYLRPQPHRPSCMPWGSVAMQASLVISAFSTGLQCLAHLR